MKKYFLFFIFLLITNCTNSNTVYWCGDHPCINKKEKEAYFKKTMTVEMKDFNKNTHKDKSNIEELLQEARVKEKSRIKNEKKLAKEIKLQKKREIKKEKMLAKQAKLEEKRRIKEEKMLAKQAKLEKKRRIKEEKTLSKEVKIEEKKIVKEEKKTFNKKNQEKIPKKNIDSVASLSNVKIDTNKFSELVEKITKQNSLRPYPDINDIPK